VLYLYQRDSQIRKGKEQSGGWLPSIRGGGGGVGFPKRKVGKGWERHLGVTTLRSRFDPNGVGERRGTRSNGAEECRKRESGSLCDFDFAGGDKRGRQMESKSESFNCQTFFRTREKRQ